CWPRSWRRAPTVASPRVGRRRRRFARRERRRASDLHRGRVRDAFRRRLHRGVSPGHEQERRARGPVPRPDAVDGRGGLPCPRGRPGGRRGHRATGRAAMIAADTIRLPISLIFSAILFSAGVYGVLARRNAVLVLMSIELMLNAVNVNLVAFSAHLKDKLFTCQIFALFVITVAAAEVGIGLAIVILIYRNREMINVDEVNLLKW